MVYVGREVSVIKSGYVRLARFGATGMVNQAGELVAGDRLKLPGAQRGRHPARRMESYMTPHAKWAIAGVAVGLILLIVNTWLALAVIGLAVAVPAIAWAALDPSQRRRIKEMRRRQLGR